MRQAAQETQRQQLLRFCKWPRATDSTVCRLAVTVPGKRGWDSLLCPTAPPPPPCRGGSRAEGCCDDKLVYRNNKGPQGGKGKGGRGREVGLTKPTREAPHLPRLPKHNGFSCATDSCFYLLRFLPQLDFPSIEVFTPLWRLSLPWIGCQENPLWGQVCSQIYSLYTNLSPYV